jgi:hypothetical protein
METNIDRARMEGVTDWECGRESAALLIGLAFDVELALAYDAGWQQAKKRLSRLAKPELRGCGIPVNRIKDWY